MVQISDDGKIQAWRQIRKLAAIQGQIVATVVLRPRDTRERGFADIAGLHFEQPRRAGIGRMKRDPDGQIALKREEYRREKGHGWLEVE